MCDLLEVQIRSRAAAGLPKYNPEVDQMTIDDPTDRQLRCLACNIKQLNVRWRRCVYCGSSLNDDVLVPDPISFKSTIAYHWLLTSLTLHGSEIVKPPFDKTERDHMQSSDVPLSDFLNFRVEWAENSVSRQLVEENSKSSSFHTDNFFFKINKDVSSTMSTEHSILGNQISTVGEATAHDRPDLSQARTSMEEERTHVFSEWKADFQFADDGNQNHVSSSSDHSMGGISADSANKLQDSESLDHSTVLAVDLSVHTDPLFRGAENVSDEHPKENLVASTMLSDWNLDELGTTASPSKPKINTTNVHLDSVDLIDDDFQWKTNNTCAIENLMVAEEQKMIKDDSFDEWNGFTGLSGLEEPSGDVENELQITNTTYPRENMAINDDSIDEWNDFTGSISSQNPSNNVRNELQTNAISITITVNTTNSEEDRAVNDYTDDVWNNLSGSISLPDPSAKLWNEWQTSDAHVTDNTTIKEHVMIKNDLFDDWNGFTGSSSLQESSGNIQIESQTHDTCVTENTTKLAKNEAINDARDGFTGSNYVQAPSIIVENELQTCITDNTKKIEENGAVDDEWYEFTGSSSIHDLPTSSWNEWQTNDTHGIEKMTLKKDLFDDWNGFTGSSSLQESSGNIQIESQTHDTCVTGNTTKLVKNEAINDARDDFIGSNYVQAPSINAENELQTCVTENTKKIEENGAVDDEWNEFTGSIPASSWNEWQTNYTHGIEKMALKKDSFDEWNDFTGCLRITSENVDNESQEKDTKVSENTDMPQENKAKNDDPIGEWNGTTCSTIALDHSRNFQIELKRNDSHVTENMAMSNEHKMMEEDSCDEWNDFTGLIIHARPENVHVELQKYDSNITGNTCMPEENKAKHDNPIDQWNSFTASNSLHDPSVVSWNEWQTNDPRGTDHMTGGKEHKTRNDDEWNDFTGAGGFLEPSGNVEIELQINNARNTENLVEPSENKTINTVITDEWNGFTCTSNLQDPSTNIWNEWQTNGNLVTENTMTNNEKRISDPFDELNLFTGSSSLPDSSANVWKKSNDFPISSKVSVENDMFSTNSKSGNIAEYSWSEWQVDNTHVPENATAFIEDKSENYDPLDAWNDFTGAGSFQDFSTNVGKELPTNDTLVTETALTGKEQMANDDPFDEWNDFIGSSNVDNSSGSVLHGNSEVSVCDLKSAEIDVFSFSLEKQYFTSMNNKFSPTK